MSTETIGEGLTGAELSALRESGRLGTPIERTPEEEARYQAWSLEAHERWRRQDEARLKEIMNSRWWGMIHRILNTPAYRRFKALPR